MWVCCLWQLVWCVEGQKGICWPCVRDLDPWRLLVFDERCVDLFSRPPSLMSTYTLPRAHILWRNEKPYGVHQQPPRPFPKSILHSITLAVCGMNSSVRLTYFCLLFNTCFYLFLKVHKPSFSISDTAHDWTKSIRTVPDRNGWGQMISHVTHFD